MQEIEHMSNGSRVPTRGWSIGANGSMERVSEEVIAIEDLEPLSGPIPEAGPTKPDVPSVPPPRPRRTSVEVFNDEMAVLDRPLEGDVEYIDEAPTSRWRKAGGFMAVVILVGVGGALVMSRHRAETAARDQQGATAPAPAATAPVLAAQAPAAVGAPAAGAAAPAPDEDEAGGDSAEGDDGEQAAPASRSAWTKVRGKGAPSTKHARSSGGKSTSHRATKTRRTVVAKHTSSRRH
jgi:hypothetical protein